MKLVYTEQAILSLNECLNFLPSDLPSEKVNEIRDQILDKADMLLINPKLGQIEKYLEHIGKSHRRLIEGYYKIVYRVEGELIFVTDIFDSRQDPSKMRA